MDRTPASEEAQRWLGTAEKLLAARDLLGAKSFAIRVREAFPRLDSAADDVVAVADTLLAGERRINGLHDWYAVLGLPRYTHNLELVATHYRRLALVLNPHRNRLPLSDDAFRLVTEAWSVLSNPSKKLFYDNEFTMFARYDYASASASASSSATTTQLHEHQFLQRNNHFFNQNQNQNQNQNNPFQTPAPAPPPPQPMQPPPPQQHAQLQRNSHQFQQQPQQPRKSPRSKEGRAVVEEERPNLNNVAESSRSARTVDSAPAPAPTPTPTPTPPPPARQAAESTPPQRRSEAEGPSFWTACPYCYIMYEYPKAYEDCTLRCQNCKRAFHAGAIPSPPIRGEGETYFCCWGFFPLGFSAKSGAAAGSSWAPFSPIFACPIQDDGAKAAGGGGGGKGKRKESGGGGGGAGGGSGSPRFVYKEDDGFVDISDDSDESDDDWRTTTYRRITKKSRTSKGKSSATKSAKTPAVGTTARVTRSSLSQAGNNAGGGGEKAEAATPAKGPPAKGESSRKVKAIASGGKKKGAVEWGRLDLNVEFSNDAEEQPPAGAAAPAAAAGTNRGNGAGHGGEEDNIEGIGFFEGLDEFLSSLPILNVVGEDKVKAA